MYTILVLNITSAVISCETETMYFPEPPLKLVEKVRKVLSLRDMCLVMRRIQIWRVSQGKKPKREVDFKDFGVVTPSILHSLDLQLIVIV